MTEGYSSGGRYNGYNDPSRQVETGLRRDFMNKVGGSVENKSNQEIIDILNGTLNQCAEHAQVSGEYLERAAQAIADAVNNAPNVQQGSKAGNEQLSRIINNSAEMLKGYQAMRGTDNGGGALAQVNGSPFLQLVNLNQRMLDALNRIERTIGSGLRDVIRNENEIDDGDDKAQKQYQDQEADEFEQLKSTILRGIMNSPTATKLGQLGASLISAGLFKVASNDKLPGWLRKGAMAAVYLQVPQTLMMLLGNVVSLQLSNWLTKGAGNILSKSLGGLMGNVGRMFGGFMGNIGGLFARLMPMAVPLIGAFLIGAGIFAGIKGIIDHRKKMKEKDAQIDNDPNLTQGQKDLKKIGEHTKSGAKVGAVAGGLGGAGIGAIIGTMIAPGIGTAIGGALGGAIAGGGLGAAIGGMVGSLKPLGQGIKHLGQNMWKGLQNVGGKVVQGTKWAIENRDKLTKFIQPIAKTLFDLLTMCNPFFRLFKMLYDKAVPFFANGVVGAVGSAVGAGVNAVKNAYNYVVGNPIGPTVNMADLGLNGTISKGNSDPRTLKENAMNVQQLDHLLSSWGYGIDYTSNMGGSHAGGPRSHASGNKLDLVLTKNGKRDVKLTKEQEAILTRLGYIGNGAVGYHNAGSGYHYDLHIGKGVKFEASDKYLQDLKKRYDDEAKKIAEEKARKEEEKRKAEEKKRKDEEWAKEHPELAKLGNEASKVVDKGVTFVKKVAQDLSQNEKFFSENKTQQMVTSANT